MDVGEGNVLMANEKTIVYDKRKHVDSITTPDGYQVPLNLDEDGNVIIPPPLENNEMISNGESEWVERPERPTHTPAQTEEKWKMQALPQLENAARQ